MQASTRELPQGTVTFLFSDIERSTEHARRLGAEFARVRSAHRRLLRECFERHHGHEIDTAGDGFFVVFERAGDAVAAAVAAQRALNDARLGEQEPVRVRMGLHSAEPFLDDDGYVGVGVSRAARICGAGHGGQVLLSNATAGIVEDLDVPGVELLDLGEHRLKDMSRSQRLFQLVVDDLPSDFPPPQSLDSIRAPASVVTLLMSDVAGWRHLLRTLGDERTAPVTRAYQSIVREVVTAGGGHVREVAGDFALSIFERPQDAVRAAVKLRERLLRDSWRPDGYALPVSMAIHSGHVADPLGQELGSAAFRCHVLCKSTEPGQLLVSHATQALLEGTLVDAVLHDLGERSFPEFDDAFRVFEVARED